MRNFGLAIISLCLMSCGAASTEQNDISSQEEIIQESGKITVVGVDEFESMIAKGNVQVVDVRTPGEVQQGVVSKGVIHADMMNDNAFAQGITSLEKSKPVLVYCKKGGRSASAADILKAKGYTVYDLDGGMDAWMDAGKETVEL